MNTKIRRISVGLSAAMVFLIAAPAGFSAELKKDETTAAEVREKAAQAYDSVKDYSVQQRDKAVAEAKGELQKLDQRIAKMQRTIDEHWQEMSAAARKESRESLDLLRQKREEAAEWYGGLKHSSGEAWDEVKKGFADSYDRLEQAVRKAAKEFENKD